MFRITRASAEGKFYAKKVNLKDNMETIASIVRAGKAVLLINCLWDATELLGVEEDDITEVRSGSKGDEIVIHDKELESIGEDLVGILDKDREMNFNYAQYTDWKKTTRAVYTFLNCSRDRQSIGQGDIYYHSSEAKRILCSYCYQKHVIEKLKSKNPPMGSFRCEPIFNHDKNEYYDDKRGYTESLERRNAELIKERDTYHERLKDAHRETEKWREKYHRSVKQQRVGISRGHAFGVCRPSGRSGHE